MKKKEDGKRKEDGVALTTWVDPSLVPRIDALADKIGITRSRMIANILEVGLDECEAFQALGFLDLVLLMEKVKAALKSRFDKDLVEAGSIAARLA